MDNDINPVQIQKYLGGVDYPTSKDKLVEVARQNGAPDDVLDVLNNIEGDREFQTPAEVSSALGDVFQ